MTNFEPLYQSKDFVSASSKNRLPYDVKLYASAGESIPLKKNWSKTWCSLPVHFETIAEEILNFDVHVDDVFVATYMKSGTTWMQECAWLLLNNLDFEKCLKENIFARSLFIEFHMFTPDFPKPKELAKQFVSPRLIKTHLPANLLPLQIWHKKPKIIYVARNVKDVIVSSFHFAKCVNLWQGSSFSEYVEDFLNNEIVYTHFWAHVVDFWLMRHEPFIFFVTYEEMQRDLPGVLQRLCQFLERPALTAQELKSFLQHVSFDSMKNNKTSNLTDVLKQQLPVYKQDLQFMRRGIVGSFKDELTAELIQKIDNWTSDFLGQYGLKEADIFGEF